MITYKNNMSIRDEQVGEMTRNTIWGGQHVKGQLQVDNIWPYS